MDRGSFSRRVLINRLRGERAVHRPPFSYPEFEFTDRCNTCQKCIAVCPTNILVRGRAGYPQVDFSKGHCTFCGACADVCDAQAFVATRDPDQAWELQVSVGEACLEGHGISCRACESWCEERAIRFRPALGGRTDIFIDQSLCTGCGACVARCPQGALNIIEPEPAASARQEELT